MRKKDNYITPTGHQKLVDELNQLVTVERIEITRIIQWAAGNGDRSENADYIYGRKRLREIDKRSNFLRKRIEAAVIVDPQTITAEVVKFGATVTVLNESKEQTVYSVVGIDEICLDKNHISWKSPIGSSLLNSTVGDVVTVKTPQNELELEIVSIEYREIIT